MNANIQPLAGIMDGLVIDQPEIASIALDRIAIRVTQRIEDVEGDWRRLTARGIESPGQSFDFIRLWVRDRAIPESHQRYVVAELDGQVVALLPLHLKRVFGVRVLTWFPGANAGCYAPIVDLERLEALGAEGRTALWRSVASLLSGAHLLFLRSIPHPQTDKARLFGELGTALETESLYRAEFTSWEHCDAEQRSRSRRKHDRQQGDRLAALGAVTFEEISDPERARPVIDTMFRQRSERFRKQGIRDCFVEDKLTGFYQAAMAASSGLDVRLHVLRLDGEVVAVRYNVVHGERMFCLISSMIDSDRIQNGSPGKQCLLRVMQTVFGDGIRTFDMGAGLTDEKRHWCNVQIPLRHHYISLSPFGEAVIDVHTSVQRLRRWAKSSPAVKGMLRRVQQWRDRGQAKGASDQLETPK
ncbi:GNAT family N-acetyltransferase [Devosia chinhatensis]|uniref:BioF2-like acetyltransferase domain-containing protein n=1 Tax=Devosia chinhatensis TaxID=429727 RepID=A0A0F5FLW4_9HYPH|nr:GNAT family N-acetyltransferase [Devosia chinhatensis]KKB09841.1 hypothetical protein VE26_08360 [Devosia chinhatensis]